MAGRGATVVRRWLLACCGMVAAMMLLGAITRLTESGLSITAWDPIAGAVPPLDEPAWRRAFAAYQAIPQYRLLHSSMSLAEFKQIFFWEWLHRLWGRLIGLAFALPLIFLAVTGRVGRSLGLRLALVFALGGVQGFIGWFMVRSGLEGATSVSPVRLALHLDGAVAIYSLLLWMALGLGRRRAIAVAPSLRGHGWLALACLVVTMTWGALVAGLGAGAICNTWPLMDGAVLPAAATDLRPVWLNPFANPLLAQFIHRWLGPLTLGVVLSLVWRGRGIAGSGLAAVGAMAAIQVGLGLATLLSHAEIVIAVIHQAGALALLTLLLITLRRFSPPAPGDG